MASPVNNTSKATASQLTKEEAVVNKKSSLPVDTLEVAKNNPKSSDSKSKGWFSSCLDTIWSWIKFIFCSGCFKKETSKENPETQEPTRAKIASSKKEETSKATLEKETPKPGSYIGLEREIFGLEWIKKAKEDNDENELKNAAAYLGIDLPESGEKDSPKKYTHFFNRISLQDLQYQIKELKKLKVFSDIVLYSRPTSEAVYRTEGEKTRYDFASEAWEAIDVEPKRSFVMNMIYKEVLEKWTHEDRDRAGSTLDALHKVCNPFSDAPEEKVAEKDKMKMKDCFFDNVIIIACRRLADKGILDLSTFKIRSKKG